MKRKKKKKLTKAQCQHIHAKARAKARYEIWFNNDLKTKFVKWIQTGDVNSKYIRSDSIRISIWAVKYNNKWIPVVYDKKRKSIVTFLPPEVLDEENETAVYVR